MSVEGVLGRGFLPVGDACVSTLLVYTCLLQLDYVETIFKVSCPRNEPLIYRIYAYLAPQKPCGCQINGVLLYRRGAIFLDV